MPLRAEERDAVWVHLLFGAVATAVIALPLPLSLGIRLWGLVLLYNALIPLVARRRGHAAWLRLWLFLLPLSALLIFPDWFLSAELGILVFADLGVPKIGTVSSFMLGVWPLPLFVIVLAGRYAARRGTPRSGIAAAAAAAFILFVGAEAILPAIPIWYAHRVATFGHVALYAVIPEIVLGVATFLVYAAVEQRAWPYRLAAACGLMLVYLGALAFFYMLVERIVLG